jgi:hypothetical protein
VAQVRAMKTLGDLNQYITNVGGIVASRQVEAREQRVAARQAQRLTPAR